MEGNALLLKALLARNMNDDFQLHMIRADEFYAKYPASVLNEQGSNLIDLRLTRREMENVLGEDFWRSFEDFWAKLKSIFGEYTGISIGASLFIGPLPPLGSEGCV